LNNRSSTRIFFFRYLLLFFSVFNILTIQAQRIKDDTINIRNFRSSDYNASVYNYDIEEDENGIIYVANANGVLSYDGSTWELTPIRGLVGARSLKITGDGKVYVGGVNEFGYLERDSIGTLQYYSLKEQLHDSVKTGQVWQIIKFKENLLFQSYRGLFSYDGNKVKHIDITKSWLLQINNKVLASVFDNGIAHIKGDSLVYVDRSFQDPDDAPFRTLPYKGTQHLLLTEEHGLYTIDTNSYMIKKWTCNANEVFKEHGLYDGLVWNDSSYLFATTRKGIYWMNHDGKIVGKITKSEGLMTNQMREFLRDSKGNLWLSGNGLVHVVFPQQQNTSNFKTLIRQIEINDSIVFIESNKIEKSLYESGSINALVFKYSSPGFDKDDLQYSSFLEGLDNKWSDWSGEAKKEYRDLSSGTYTFYVKARLQNGEESLTDKLTIHIPSLWYRTKGAYVVGVFLFLLIIWMGTNYRNAKLKLKNVHLEKLISERTSDLIIQKEELIVANNELDNFVYRSSHDLIAPLKSLKGLINITRNESSEDLKEEYFDMMENSIVKLEDFIKSILEYSSNSKMEIKKEAINLNEIVDTILDDLKYFDNAENVTFYKEIDTIIEFKSDPKRLKIILSNLIANAIKYHNYRQPSPYIKVILKNVDDRTVIEVEDNGQGITQQHISTIFNMFVRASDTSEGSGLGLYIVKDTVGKLGGTIEVNSEYGVGSVFSVIF